MFAKITIILLVYGDCSFFLFPKKPKNLHSYREAHAWKHFQLIFQSYVAEQTHLERMIRDGSYVLFFNATQADETIPILGKTKIGIVLPKIGIVIP